MYDRLSIGVPFWSMARRNHWRIALVNRCLFIGSLQRLIYSVFQTVAIRAIDETLYKRGKIHLIAGQPLYIVDHPASGIPTKKPNVDNSSTWSSIQPHATTSRDINATSVAPFPLDISVRSSPASTAGPSKRPSSLSHNEGPSKKKVKPSTAGCVVCGQTPHHLVKDCPVVAQGPKS
jgi:chromodomain-helicase-DNA-binding protein 4